MNTRWAVVGLQTTTRRFAFFDRFDGFSRPTPPSRFSPLGEPDMAFPFNIKINKGVCMEANNQPADDSENNQQSLDGAYGPWGILIAIVVLLFLAIQDVLFFQIYSLSKNGSAIFFSAVMMNCLGGVLLLFPYLSNKIGFSEESWLVSFLALPAADAKINFPAISNFLGEQALGGFLGTVLFLSTKQIASSLGPVAAGFFCFAIALPSILIATISYFRFVLLFARFSWKSYGIASFISFAIMSGFYWAGVKSVS